MAPHGIAHWPGNLPGPIGHSVLDDGTRDDEITACCLHRVADGSNECGPEVKPGGQCLRAEVQRTKGSVHRPITQEYGLVPAVPQRQSGRKKWLEITACARGRDDKDAPHFTSNPNDGYRIRIFAACAGKSRGFYGMLLGMEGTGLCARQGLLRWTNPS
jgi:hypothetical protein